MRKAGQGEALGGVAFLLLLLTTIALPVIAFIAWKLAVDLEPCKIIVRDGGGKCANSPLSAFAGGGIAIVVGLAIVQAAVKNGRRTFGNWRDTVMVAWIGVCIAASGAALIYAASTMRSEPVMAGPERGAALALGKIAPGLSNV